MGRSRVRRSDESSAQSPPKRRRHRYNTRASSRVKRDQALGGVQEGRKVVISDEDYREKNKVLKEETIGSPLLVKELDTHSEQNRAKHYTDLFEQDDLIVRRGQEFTLTLTFDRKVNKEDDEVVLQFSYGARPQESKDTIIRVPIELDTSASGDKEGWTATATEFNDKKVTITVMTEPDSNIGKYTLYVETKVTNGKKDFSRAECDETLYMLFNPWCKDDLVYMENAEERNEYVLLDHGYIWVGSKYRNHGRPWNFGQFESPVLEVTLDLLDKGELGDSARNSPVSIIRCLSALINSNDDNGLLEGRWGSEYPKDCTRPTSWSGSVAICEEYQKTQKPVRFGQCWVFSGVGTTLLRCLGIPTRSVTNFESAHDHDCSMTIDKHYDEDGLPSESVVDDSVWNFHVWNESFFKRIDLPEGYDGWQAHDATPQEESEGVSRCGPAPIAAIKKGHVYLNFDVGFIFSEINGDRVTWEVAKDGTMSVQTIDKYSVGVNISTKAVGSANRHDLTNDYKYKEGTPEERKVVRFVNRFSSRRRQNIYKLKLDKQVNLEVVVPEDKEVGDDIEVGVKVRNDTPEKKTMKVTLSLASTFYTGVVGRVIMYEVMEKSVESEKTGEFTMTVSSKDYEGLMNSAALFQLTAHCKVKETNKNFAATEVFDLNMPALRFDIPEKIPSYTDLVIPITFTNTTNLKLHNGVINAEGSYLVKDKSKAYRVGKVLHPGDEFTAEVAINSRRIGERTIIATFSSDELTNIVDEDVVNVVSKNEEDEKEAMEEDN